MVLNTMLIQLQDSLGCDINKAYNFKNVSLI